MSTVDEEPLPLLLWFRSWKEPEYSVKSTAGPEKGSDLSDKDVFGTVDIADCTVDLGTVGEIVYGGIYAEL